MAKTTVREKLEGFVLFACVVYTVKCIVFWFVSTK